MYETLLRPHHVDAAPALTPIGAVGARLKQSEARREEKRLRQIANARAGAERRAAKRKAEDDEDDEEYEEEDEEDEEDDADDDEDVRPVRGRRPAAPPARGNARRPAKPNGREGFFNLGSSLTVTGVFSVPRSETVFCYTHD